MISRNLSGSTPRSHMISANSCVVGEDLCQVHQHCYVKGESVSSERGMHVTSVDGRDVERNLLQDVCNAKTCKLRLY